MKPRWTEYVAMGSVAIAWGQFVSYLSYRLFPHDTLAFVVFGLVGCVGGGLLLGRLYARLTWPRKRRELLKQMGFEDYTNISDEEIERRAKSDPRRW